MILYHYTCAHRAPEIAKAGRLIGSPHRMLPQIGSIVWLTDLDVGARRVLGMPPIQNGCDRMAWRASVDLTDPLHWPRWARQALHKHQWTAVEVNCPGSLISHWWLSLSDVPILSIQPT